MIEVGLLEYPEDKDWMKVKQRALVTVGNVLQFLCPAFVLVKFPFDYGFIRRSGSEVSFGIALLLALLYDC